SIPIVTDVGGLHDTVEPIITKQKSETGTGIVAARVATDALHAACVAAMRLHEDKAAHQRAVARAMARSNGFGWSASAEKYRALYADLCS
ncbi:MAG: hypothetical protein K0S65_4677, partial [Labilithrix sp.]|nr:hypothetical protein [Labilithrix sp.]